jgi:hypothetical protein
MREARYAGSADAVATRIAIAQPITMYVAGSVGRTP